MKRWTIIFILALALIPHLTVNAAGVNLEMEIDETIGIIEDSKWGELHIIGEALTYGGLDEVVMQIGDAPIYDLTSGLPVSVSSIKAGMEARVAYYQYEDDLPQAVAIWLHPSHEDAAVFSTTVSDNIYYGADYTVFLSACGRYRITLTEDTFIFVPGLGPITLEDIVPGQEFFVWVDTITASSPALVYPDKVVSICQLQ